MGKILEVISAYGHENIKATHKTTFEITKEKELTPRGDCIIGVRADKSIRDVNEELKQILRNAERVEVVLRLPDYGLEERLFGFGSKKMSFEDENDVVVRKSDFVCGRTLLIRASKAARDLSREFVELLKDRKTIIEMLVIVEK
ncbi:Protein of unknown function DUF371 [Ferroglobus placidus DSM 10642]|uniref:DUF371 domain-containing protein n=1 Tax=Ferroglobus placidus (strain DSM 10642 / AEDII12DO) TaxID=589924 RepID=D3RY66_FERPA|nr:DUF371 domain-containing protein [Ferroglobus placidus]ADC65429.1 Protein of unknown function DUF371 [Ferroglobus placidus DSM 10642]